MKAMQRKAKILAISTVLGSTIETNADLAMSHPEWEMQRIESKTGILQRHISGEKEFTSHLAMAAAAKLLQDNEIIPGEIDFVIVCTQTSDYLLPSLACLIQNQLGLRKTTGALDINQGCAGYVYGLALANSMISSGLASKILFITGDTYSKIAREDDRSVKTLFGDAATATLIGIEDSSRNQFNKFHLGSDGSGFHLLTAPQNKFSPSVHSTLYMNGPEVYKFTAEVIPNAVNSYLNEIEMNLNSIDFFVFHQANTFILETLRRRLNIPKEKFLIKMQTTGNTVSSSIPLVLKQASDDGEIKEGDKILLVGFGTGFSWGITLIEWRQK